MKTNLRRRCKENPLAERVLIKIAQRLDALLIRSIKFQPEELKKMKTTTNRHWHLSADELREAAEQILNKSDYLFNLIDSPGHVSFHSEVTAATAYYTAQAVASKHNAPSTSKSTTAIKTVEQLLGISPTKTNIKTNFKNSCFGKGSQNIHKQHKQNSR